MIVGVDKIYHVGKTKGIAEAWSRQEEERAGMHQPRPVIWKEQPQNLTRQHLGT